GRMLKLQRQGRLGTFGPCTGQEAASCAPALAMGEKDWLVTAFREMGGRLLRGEKPVRTLLFHNGYEEGNHNPDAPRLLPISIIVGTQTLQAVGIAYAMRRLGEKDSAVVTFVGDGGTSEGEFYEAMNFAGVWQAPVVFVIQNNQWAISIPRNRQTRAATLAQKAIAAGIPSIQVDGNDALAMYRASREALDRAHGGGGPTVIEAVTYRLMMHTTSDDPTRYRDDAEVQAWWKRDPIPRFKGYLERKGIWDAEKQSALEAEVRAEVEAAVRELEDGDRKFKPDAQFDHVFGTRHQDIEEQRALFLREIEIAAEAGASRQAAGG
ncbi:MAG: thiamine pyrophosphate-dependent dehydrogenase E1 component subunit alpha, partial [Deltaproteobacteria bacterium]|nr:thiamine pyrophosphate-dependent dehydrogenase E1 component subunit alpha [Deltaproteobacteria bacterium]